MARGRFPGRGFRGRGGRFDWRQRPHLSGSSRREFLLVGWGGALLALSTVLPWVQVALLGGLDLYRLQSVAAEPPVLPWAVLALGVALLVVAYVGVAVRALGLIALISTVAVAVGAGGDFVRLYLLVNRSGGALSFGVGFFMAVLAVILIGVAAVRLRRSTPGPTRAADSRPAPEWRVTREPPADRQPGWKQDPWGVQGATRWWDGGAWTRQTRDRPGRRYDH